MNVKLITLSLLAVLALICGAATAFLFPNSATPPTDIALMIVGSFLLFLWYCADAHQRSFKRSPGLNIFVVALAGVGMPYYFFRSRGFKGGLLATILFFLAVLALGVLSSIGAFAVYAAQA